jgi:diguanylate cyclase (GGDEF)-like protein
MVSAVLGSVMYLSYRVLRATLESVHKVRLVAEKLTGGDMQARVEVEHQDEIGALGTALNDMADGLNRLVEELEAEATRDNFGRQLTDALGMADDEAAIYEVVSRALASVDGDAPMEMLLSDSSEAHLRVVAEHPVGQGPGCGVGSPWSCVAVRRNQQVHFPDSTALDACPMLRDRPAGACSAVCTPISFTGRSIGVLHATGPVEAPVSPGYVQKLETLASQAGARIGTLRVFARTELQATTDGLTGLINRRTFEERARKLLTDNTEFALAMCDLDHFKKLNDTYGHEAGDRALRLFGKVVRDSVRDGDIVARYGGEEFVVILPDVDDRHAREILERLQTKIAASQADAGVPPFTISCGVASTSLSRNLEELYRVADVALYQAKETGRNCVVVASEAPPEMDEEEELEVATSTEDFGDIGFAGVVAETDEFLHVFS